MCSTVNANLAVVKQFCIERSTETLQYLSYFSASFAYSSLVPLDFNFQLFIVVLKTANKVSHFTVDWPYKHKKSTINVPSTYTQYISSRIYPPIIV